MFARILTAAFILLATSALETQAQSVQYFPVPEGAHPHDVAPAPDGTVWYTAQGAGALGLLDPKSGAVKQIPLGEDRATRRHRRP